MSGSVQAFFWMCMFLVGSPLVSMVYVKAMVAQDNVIPNWSGPKLKLETVLCCMAMIILWSLGLTIFLDKQQFIQDFVTQCLATVPLIVYFLLSFEMSMILIHPAPGTYEYYDHKD